MTLLEKVKEIVDENYDLGTVETVRQIGATYINKGFQLKCKKNGKVTEYYARQYHSRCTLATLRYEHALPVYLHERDSSLVAPLMKTKSGETFVHAAFEGTGNFYCVNEWLPGDEPYTWVFNNVSDQAFESMFTILAKFHAHLHGFAPPEGTDRVGMDFVGMVNQWIKELPEIKEGMSKQPSSRFYYEYLERTLPYTLQRMTFIRNEFIAKLDKLPHCVVHGDTQPGNFKFVDDKATKIFDFDYSCTGPRVLDIAWCCRSALTGWYYEDCGVFRLGQLKLAIKSYNDAIKQMDCLPGPLTQEEIDFFPTMLAFAAGRVAYDISKQMHDEPERNVFEWCWYYTKMLRILHYLEDHEADIKAAMQS